MKKKKFQHDDVAGIYLLKTKTISLPIDDLPNEKNGHKYQENEFQEEIELSFESPSEIAINRSNREQLVKFEYHVLYHISYSVPYLCFNAYRSSKFYMNNSNCISLGISRKTISKNLTYILYYSIDGSMLTLDEAWKIFKDMNPMQLCNMQQNMLHILTQMEHPILFKPFLTLHPCRIAEVLQSLPYSQNKVLSFLSIYGSTVYLTFDLEYAKYLQKIDTKKIIE